MNDLTDRPGVFIDPNGNAGILKDPVERWVGPWKDVTDE